MAPKDESLMTDNIILYDLPSRDPLHAWSLNPLKTRLALNYKGVKYTTLWCEYPQIKPTFEPLGIPPNKHGTQYTIPVVRFPPKTASDKEQWIMDSKPIAVEIEACHPEPSMHLDSDILPKVEALIPKTAPLSLIYVPRVPRDILNKASQYYFHKTRSERFGMSLDELEKSEKGGETAWKAIEAPMKEMADLLRQNGGPYFMGKQVSYSDFVVVGLFQFMRRTGEDDIFGRIMKMHPEFPRLYEACAEWLKRDDY